MSKHKTKSRRLPALAGDQQGQAMTEYAVTVGALIALVFAFSSDSLPFFPALIEVFQIYLDSLHTVVTLPIP